MVQVSATCTILIALGLLFLYPCFHYAISSFFFHFYGWFLTFLQQTCFKSIAGEWEIAHKDHLTVLILFQNFQSPRHQSIYFYFLLPALSKTLSNMQTFCCKCCNQLLKTLWQKETSSSQQVIFFFCQNILLYVVLCGKWIIILRVFLLFSKVPARNRLTLAKVWKHVFNANTENGNKTLSLLGDKQKQLKLVENPSHTSLIQLC